MAHWIKNTGGISRNVVTLMATLGVTACVTIGVAFGQYSNQYQNVNPNLPWQTPVIHGQQMQQPQPQVVQKPKTTPSHVQLVQHLEPAQTALLPTVDMIDSPTTPTLAPPPVNGSRIAQGGIPGPGANSNARLDTMFPQGNRPSAIGSPNVNSGMSGTVPAPNLSTLRDNSYGNIGANELSTMPIPGRSGERISECPDPREIGIPMDQVTVTIDINIDWDKMDPCSINVDDFRPRTWQQTCVQRNASNLCTSAAYFEHVSVERYGHSWGPLMQPFVSAAHFYGSVVFLPYKMGLTPPCECVYTLGYYRPGSCVPFMIDPIPLSLRAGVAQAGAVVGVAHLIPVP